ncbi:tyrosine--tRNA mitochondrial [Brachionus plicatilis]|uniref:Tyrosine--tRNA mitochondrial n=1 Tax=Brachionus plicatilis TaxID=10195 RepID=A0A3M7Q1F9_BRAPC|nr:tyrosine--tRNA mitochondrial [Brachionus plicatilis]
MNVIKFMSLYAKHLRMGDLLSRKQQIFLRIETRIKSKEGINYTEFSYQLFQAYDWYHLMDTYNCTIQVRFYLTFKIVFSKPKKIKEKSDRSNIDRNSTK